MVGIQPEGSVRGAPADPNVLDPARSGAEPAPGGSADTDIGRGSRRRSQWSARVTGAQPPGEATGAAGGAGAQGDEAEPDGRSAGGRGRRLTNSTGVLVAVSLLLVCLVVAVASTISWQVKPSSEHPTENAAASSGSSATAQVKVAGGLDAATPSSKPSVKKTTAAKTPTAQATQTSSAAAAAAQQPTQTPSASTAPVAQTFGGVAHVLLWNLGTGMCADLPNFAAGKIDGKIEQYTCTPGSGDNQLWTLKIHDGAEGPNGARLFTISNDKDNLCMDLPDYGSQPSGTTLSEYSCQATTKDNQLWYLAPVYNTYYQLRNLASNGMCLSVVGGTSGSTDARLDIRTCQSTADAWAMKAG